MTDRNQALTDLLAKVEAGERIPWKDFIPAFGLSPENKPQNAAEAYAAESLDAAKALHDAVLPEWTRSVDATAPECGIDVSVHPPIESKHPIITATDDSEVRAWLIAILKALIVQEGEA